MNVVTPSTYNGVSGTIRPTLIGPYTTSRGLTLPNGNVSFIHAGACATILLPDAAFLLNPRVWHPAPQRAHCPGLADTDVSLEKTTKVTEATALVVRIDAFDLLNHANFANPTLTATGASTSTFGQISATRTAVGDAGSSRQLQFAMRFEF